MPLYEAKENVIVTYINNIKLKYVGKRSSDNNSDTF